MAKITGAQWLQRRGLTVVTGDPLNDLLVDDESGEDSALRASCEQAVHWARERQYAEQPHMRPYLEELIPVQVETMMAFHRMRRQLPLPDDTGAVDPSPLLNAISLSFAETTAMVMLNLYGGMVPEMVIHLYRTAAVTAVNQASARYWCDPGGATPVTPDDGGSAH